MLREGKNMDGEEDGVESQILEQGLSDSEIENFSSYMKSSEYLEAIAWLEYSRVKCNTRHFFNRDLKHYQNSKYSQNHNCYLFAQEQTGNDRSSPNNKNNPNSFFVGGKYEDRYQGLEGDKLIKKFSDHLTNDGLIQCEKDTVVPAGYKKIYACLSGGIGGGFFFDYHFYSLYKQVGHKEEWVEKKAWRDFPQKINVAYGILHENIDITPEQAANTIGYKTKVGYFLVPDMFTRNKIIEAKRQKAGLNPKHSDPE